MNQSLEQLEANVYRLTQKFETLLGENRRLNEENRQLQLAAQQQKQEHEAAVNELSQAMIAQVGRQKEDFQARIDSLTGEFQHRTNALTADFQAKIDSLTAEKEQYRHALENSAAQIRNLLARLPQEANG